MSSNMSKKKITSFTKKAILIVKLVQKPRKSEIYSDLTLILSRIAILGIIAFIIRLILISLFDSPF